MAMRSRHRLRLHRLRVLWVGGLAAAWGLLQMGCTVYPSEPADPAFDTDVLPIFEAHCTRCHGSGPDGGSLKSVYVYVPGVGSGVVTTQPPCLTQYGNNSNSAGCVAGAASYASLIKTYIQPGAMYRMPPPPAPELTPWEMEVVEAWATPKTPLCSRSSNPDPALLCTSM
jgi:hypothetical protein